MSDTSSLEQSNEHMLQSALATAFQSTDIAPKSGAAAASAAPASLSDAPTVTLEIQEDSEAAEEDAWKGEYEAQVEEWRAQSAEARAKAERERARWEQIRKREAEERQALGQEPENWDALGSHITSSFAAASEVLASSSASLASTSLTDSGHLVNEQKGPSSHLHTPQHLKMDSGSPSQKWEHIDSSPTSSYPSMSFPETSIPSSPSPPHVALQQTTGRYQPEEQHSAERKPSNVPPSTIPSLLDSSIAPRTRMNLLLSSLAINLFLPFVNGVMLGFGEIFAKNVLVGWMGWKSQSGRTATNVGVRR
ncbi:uncharacterized protein F5147DRAFT_214050 [Suillus discolor]|uniref:Uncharacterized protein n=1 Tax=Suillus discolor TaxID=1912936 RepID=A0A9P7F4T7_9AGAM|nr:uncharacterized protein F5147DRAFT_214050 [Suillus discolor]KAG2107298.1 hypothetical protein F5147DRAFT_214050 [Suillus discolor]